MSYSKKANYKKLGDYVEVVNIRNKELEVKTLLGVSIKKVLMPSIANTVGTNMKPYKIIEKNQFAYGPVTSRNGDKISIALLEEHENAIVSQAYTVFEVIDKNILNPEYLMMWFRRPEFDRYARFKSHGSARETFDWEELCDIELPIPSIEKQNAIVKEYNTVVNRIKLNETLNQKLEETAQALYKHWFVDFEFPNKDGKPYKSNGGKMVFNEELDKEIPEGWEVFSLLKLSSIKHGYAFKGEWFSEEETDFILISPGNFKINGGFNFAKNKYYKGKYSNDYVLIENDLIVNMTDLSKKGDTLGSTALIPEINFKTKLHNQRVGKFEIFDKRNIFYIYFLTNQFDYKNYILGSATGTTVRHTSPSRISAFKFDFPSVDLIEKFNFLIAPIIKKNNQNPSNQYKLEEIKSLLLSKMTKVESENKLVSTLSREENH